MMVFLHKLHVTRQHNQCYHHQHDNKRQPMMLLMLLLMVYACTDVAAAPAKTGSQVPASPAAAPTDKTRSTVTTPAPPRGQLSLDYEYVDIPAATDTSGGTQGGAKSGSKTANPTTKTKPSGASGGGPKEGLFYPLYGEAMRRREQMMEPPTGGGWKMPPPHEGQWRPGMEGMPPGAQPMGGAWRERYEWLRERVRKLWKYGLTKQVDDLQKQFPKVNLTEMYHSYNYYGGGDGYEMGEGGYFYNGTYYRNSGYGEMEDGYWYNGTFYPGEMEGPEMEDGYWYNGTWYGGENEMEDGYYYNGTWYPGEMEGPEMEDGYFHNGTFYPGYEQEGYENEGYEQEGPEQEDLMWWQLHHPKWRDGGVNQVSHQKPQLPPPPTHTQFQHQGPPPPGRKFAGPPVPVPPWLAKPNAPVQRGPQIPHLQRGPQIPHLQRGPQIPHPPPQQPRPPNPIPRLPQRLPMVQARPVPPQPIPPRPQTLPRVQHRPNIQTPPHTPPRLHPGQSNPPGGPPRPHPPLEVAQHAKHTAGRMDNPPLHAKMTGGSRDVPPNSQAGSAPGTGPNTHINQQDAGLAAMPNNGQPNIPGGGMGGAPPGGMPSGQNAPQSNTFVRQKSSPLDPYRMSSTVTWGIVIASIIGVTVILAPLACLLYKYRQEKRIKKRTFLRRPEHGSVDDGIMDAMIMTDLGEKKGSRVQKIGGGGSGGKKWPAEKHRGGAKGWSGSMPMSLSRARSEMRSERKSMQNMTGATYLSDDYDVIT